MLLVFKRLGKWRGSGGKWRGRGCETGCAWAQAQRPPTGRELHEANDRGGYSPNISFKFCTAAPEAPLPRLSSLATSTAW